MRIIRRASKDDHEEESVFVPMTDMTVSFLFIVMILLAFFAVQFSDEDNVPRLLYEKVLEERNEFERDIKTLEAKIIELNQTIDDLKLENEFLERENSRLIDENKQLETRIEEAKREIADLNIELELLEKKLKKFMQSVFNLSKELGSKKALKKAGWRIEELDLIEANEAFAAQACAVNKEMGWDPSIVNVNGGSIAIGHPIGASGCRILTTLLFEMKRRDAKKGLVTLCIGGGMGVAMCVERL